MRKEKETNSKAKYFDATCVSLDFTMPKQVFSCSLCHLHLVVPYDSANVNAGCGCHMCATSHTHFQNQKQQQ